MRVEDTDRERSTPEAIETLLNAMEWLGLDVDEEPLYQSHRMDAHVAAAETLLEEDWRIEREKGGPGQGMCFFGCQSCDFISRCNQGTLTKAPENMEDFVIVRSNGTPVFHLANVLDDIEQGITHVIRGDDHIENTIGILHFMKHWVRLYRFLGICR